MILKNLNCNYFVYVLKLSQQITIFKTKFNKIKDKDFYFIGSCVDPSKESINGALETINCFLRCVDNVKLQGVFYGLGLNDQGEARYSKSLQQAYELGKNI